MSWQRRISYNDFILGIEDILGVVNHEDAETGDATGTVHPGNGINYALLAVWIRGCANDNNKTKTDQEIINANNVQIQTDRNSVKIDCIETKFDSKRKA